MIVVKSNNRNISNEINFIVSGKWFLFVLDNVVKIVF